MLEIFRCELKAKELASLTVKVEKCYEKGRKNHRYIVFYIKIR